jgi:WD40 repeat protein
MFQPSPALQNRGGRVWDIDQRRKACDLPEVDLIQDASFLSSDDSFVTVSADGTARLWYINAEKGECIHRDVVAENLGSSPSVSVSAHGDSLAITSDDGAVLLFPIHTQQYGVGPSRSTMRHLKGHEKHVSSVSFGPGSERLLTLSDDGTAGLWSPASGHRDVPLAQAEGGRSAALEGHVARSGERVVLSDGGAGIWDLRSKALARPRDEGSRPCSVPLSADGNRVATIKAGESVTVVDLRSEPVPRMMSDSAKAVSCALSPDGSQLLALSRAENGSCSAGLWDASDGRRLRTVTEGSRCGVVGFSADGRALFYPLGESGSRVETSGSHGSVQREFDVPDREVVAIGEDKVAIRPCASGRHGISILDRRDRHELTPLKGGSSPGEMAFGCGSKLLSAAVEGRAQVWETDTGEWVANLELPGKRIVGVTFPDRGPGIRTVSSDGHVQVWDAPWLHGCLGPGLRISACVNTPLELRRVTKGDLMAGVIPGGLEGADVCEPPSWWARIFFPSWR